MIFEGFITAIIGVLNVLLAPLEAINVFVDYVSGIAVVSDFINIVAYIFPWSNLLPLFTIIFLVIFTKIVLGSIRAVLGYINGG